jgi:predicted AlkP superfamily pyrophosphatase or phosphodiesterase
VNSERKLALAIFLVSTLSAVFPSGAAWADEGRQPVRLVLQVTVDGLRADLLARGVDYFETGGFRQLLGQGAVFTNTHYDHANTETIVGHATLATGAHPAQHGMTGNVWFDSASGELSYNIEDPDSPLLAVREEQMSGDQVDPAQRLARTAGRSPRALLAQTLADKLLMYTGGRAKVFGVSGKDRSAVAMAGHGGKAFWFSTDSGDFVTADYYYEAYPNWVAGWNAGRRADAHAGTQWSLLAPKESYQLGHQDDRPYEIDLRGYGRTFPHRFGSADNKLLFTQIVASPVGDRLLADFARELVRSENLGQDEVTDYLSVSFSGVDAVNHFFGPSSLETEDMVRQLDRTLADFFAFLDESVGLHNMLIVLSADHGMAEMPEYATELGIPAGRLYSEDIEASANRIGDEQLGIEGVVRFFYRPYLYLDHDRIIAAGMDVEEASARMASVLEREPGVHAAVTTSRLASVTDRDMARRIRNNYHPQRAGDIYVVQRPYWFNFEKGPVAAMHGSPWKYDTHVPLPLSWACPLRLPLRVRRSGRYWSAEKIRIGRKCSAQCKYILLDLP